MLTIPSSLCRSATSRSFGMGTAFGSATASARVVAGAQAEAARNYIGGQSKNSVQKDAAVSEMGRCRCGVCAVPGRSIRSALVGVIDERQIDQAPLSTRVRHWSGAIVSADTVRIHLAVLGSELAELLDDAGLKA